MSLNAVREDGFLADRVLPDGRWLTLVPLTFGRSRLCIGPKGADHYDDGW